MSKYFVIARDPWDYDRIIKRHRLDTSVTFMARSLADAMDGLTLNRKVGIRAEIWSRDGRVRVPWFEQLLDDLESGAINATDELARLRRSDAA